ncbi:MAG: NYN domain-containing protein [Massilia sp.]
MTLFEQHIIPSSMPPGIQSVLLPLCIKFFTAKIVESAAKADDSVSSQARYHTALSKLYDGRIELIEGYYSITKFKAKIVDGDKWPRECDEVVVWKLEEKQSDVNLALQAYHDAATGEVDQVIIVTNDTDIVPALKLIREHTTVVIGLVIPTKQSERKPNKDLADQAHWVRNQISENELANSQLPRVIHGRKPTLKPTSWYARPDLLEQVLELATPVLGTSGKVFKWMEEKNPYLDNQAPIDLIETDVGAASVFAYIAKYVAEVKVSDKK